MVHDKVTSYLASIATWEGRRRLSASSPTPGPDSHPPSIVAAASSNTEKANGTVIHPVTPPPTNASPTPASVSTVSPVVPTTP